MTPRKERERKTVHLMIGLYCASQHHPVPCAECAALQNYVDARIEHCRYEPKPQCKNCPTHCYGKDMREKIKQVMRDAGPRMLLHHPLLTLRHWLD